MRPLLTPAKANYHESEISVASQKQEPGKLEEEENSTSLYWPWRSLVATLLLPHSQAHNQLAVISAPAARHTTLAGRLGLDGTALFNCPFHPHVLHTLNSPSSHITSFIFFFSRHCNIFFSPLLAISPTLFFSLFLFLSYILYSPRSTPRKHQTTYPS